MDKVWTRCGAHFTLSPAPGGRLPLLLPQTLNSFPKPPHFLPPPQVLNFPFPTPPGPSALRTAHRCLEALSAIEPPGGGDSVSGTGGALTPLGRAMSAFPISPRHARMLLEVVAWQAQQQQQDKGPASCSASAPEAVVSAGKKRKSAAPSKGTLELALPYAVALAAALSVESPFIHVEHAVRGEGGSGGYVTQVWDTILSTWSRGRLSKE